MADKYKRIKITVTEEYLIPMCDDERTEINGWTPEKVIEDWFHNWPLDSYHASRDTHRIGNTRKLISAEVLDL